MTDVAISAAVMGDADDLAPRLRPADVEELLALGRFDLAHELRHCIATSAKAWAGRADGELVALFGVIDLGRSVGAPWLLASAALDRHAVPFLRRCRPYRDEMRAGYVRLCNWVDARNETAVRWLRWLGFTIAPAGPFGPFRMPFHRFDMEGRR